MEVWHSIVVSQTSQTPCLNIGLHLPISFLWRWIGPLGHIWNRSWCREKVNRNLKTWRFKYFWNTNWARNQEVESALLIQPFVIVDALTAARGGQPPSKPTRQSFWIHTEPDLCELKILWTHSHTLTYRSAFVTGEWAGKHRYLYSSEVPLKWALAFRIPNYTRILR